MVSKGWKTGSHCEGPAIRSIWFWTTVSRSNIFSDIRAYRVSSIAYVLEGTKATILYTLLHRVFSRSMILNHQLTTMVTLSSSSPSSPPECYRKDNHKYKCRPDLNNIYLTGIPSPLSVSSNLGCLLQNR